MEAVRYFTLIAAGVLLINLVLSTVFWLRYRTKLHRYLVWVWAASIVGSVIQGSPVVHPLGVSFLLLPSVLVSLSLAGLLASMSDQVLHMRRYLAVLGGGALLSVGSYLGGLPFWANALPLAVAVVLPVLDTGLRVLFSSSSRGDLPAKAAAFSAVVYGLHTLDYPFLRDKPQFAVIGFMLALLVVFMISIAAPAAVLDRVVRERSRIEEVNRFQRQFFANITHELRTPLTMILAPLESVIEGEFGPLTPTQRRYLEANHRNAIRLLRLIDDLLDLAKMEEGFLRLRIARFDLRALVEEVVAYARPMAARKNLQLELVAKQVPADLEGDAEKLERVLVNVVANALKFTSEGGVTITIDSPDGEAEIAVADTGIGIKAEALPRIFERFNQGDGSVTRRYGGTGIGLAYAKEIVELHGGRLSVESTPGKGSRFAVRLRRGALALSTAAREVESVDTGAEPREWVKRTQRLDQYRFAELAGLSEPAPVAQPESSSRDARVLVVEDHADILELITLQLRSRYLVYVAANGKTGLALARRERPDLIVTDYMMPEMDGLSMLKELRNDAQFAETPIIMLTAKNLLEDRLAATDAGADVYLSKPFSPRELEANIRGLLEKRGRHVHNLMQAHAEGLEIVSGGLAHELQNPLNFIKGAQHLIVEQVEKIREQVAGAGLADPGRVAAIDKARKKVDRLMESATRGVSRIEDVVALLRRYAREGFPTEQTDVPLDNAVADVTGLVAPRDDIACKVELDLDAANATVRCIPEELNQVVRTLVQNAIESVGDKGTVRVRTRSDAKRLVLEVSDDGAGIAPDDVTKIFSPFYTTKTGTGRGLGLAILDTIVSRAGGTVEVTSVPNVETTFRVRLAASTPLPATLPSGSALPLAQGQDSGPGEGARVP